MIASTTSPAMQAALDAVRESARIVRRRRIRFLARHYNRERHLPHTLPLPFRVPHSSPLGKLALEYVSYDARTTRSIISCICAHIRSNLDVRHKRDVEARIDALRVCLVGELENYRRARHLEKVWRMPGRPARAAE